MQQILQKYKGMNIHDVDLNEVETLLQEQGLFSDSSAEFRHDKDGNLVLAIEVSEKISFLPIPFAMYSSKTGVMGGLMLMDTNAFGVKDTYIVGGIFSRTMQLAVMSFSKPSLSRAQPGFSVSGSFMHRNQEYQNLDEETVLECNALNASASFAITDKMTEHSSVNAGVRYNYSNLTPDDDYVAYENELEPFHAITLTGSWGISFPELNEWFLSTKRVRAAGEATFFTDGEKSQSLMGEIAIQQPLPVTRLRALAHVAMLYTHERRLSQWVSQTAVGTTILADSFHTPQLGGATMGLECGLFKSKVATFSVYGLYECAAVKDWKDGDRVIQQGYSAGAKMYLAKIAFPAMSFGFSHNITTNKMKFAVALGMQF